MQSSWSSVCSQSEDSPQPSRSHTNLITPITIGREEGNTIQLNDERVSRFHLKIQEDHEKLVLTDLDGDGLAALAKELKLKTTGKAMLATLQRARLA